MVTGGHWVGRSVFWRFIHKCPGKGCSVAAWLVRLYRRELYLARKGVET
jgi:hypothetical protein